MKYSHNKTGDNPEKKDRAGIYNGIGGHVEKNETILEAAKREALEEAGITLINPKLKGVININNFSGKNILNFIITATIEDIPLSSTEEGSLEYIDNADIHKINTFPDTPDILSTLSKLKENEVFVGTALYDGKFGLLSMEIKIM